MIISTVVSSSWKCLINMLAIAAALFCASIAGYGQNPDNHFMKEVQDMLDSVSFYKMRSPARSLMFGEKVLRALPETGYEELRYKALINCAHAEKILQHRERALQYCDNALHIAEHADDIDRRTETFFVKASIFNFNNLLDSAIVYFQKVIELDYPGADAYHICNAYTSIGGAYQRIENLEKAEEYYLKGIRCSQRDESTRSYTLVPLIQFYVRRNDIRYLTYLDTLMLTGFFEKTSPLALANHFDSFLLLDKSSDAEKEQRLRQVYQYNVDNHPVADQVYYGLILASHLREQKKYLAADTLLRLLLDKAVPLSDKRAEMYTRQTMARNNQSLGKLNEAVTDLERCLSLQQQITADENRKAVNELNIKFETAQKDFQLEQQKTHLAQENRNKQFLIILLVLASALSVVTFVYLRSRIRSVRRIARQDKVIHDQEREYLLKQREFAALTASMEARERERQRIARDLHDEIGSTLSSIHIYSSAASKAIQDTPEKALQFLSRIKENTRKVMENMSDIVWAINMGSRDMSLERKLKNYGYELLTPLGINCIYDIQEDAEDKLEQIEARKNILLIAKEAMNNIAKYSGATEASVHLELAKGSLLLKISDNGKGFIPGQQKEGHGLSNMQKRAGALGGFLSIESSVAKGTAISCDIPLANISDTEIKIAV